MHMLWILHLIEKIQSKINKLITYSQAILDRYESQNIEKFGSVFKCYNGGTFKSKDYVENSKYKLITIKNIDDNGFNTDKTSCLDINKIDNKYKLYLGDLLLTMTGNIGRVGIVDEMNCYLNQRVLKLTSPSKLYLFSYLLKYKKDIISLGKGTAQQNLSLQDLNEMNIYNTKDEVEKYKQYDFIYDLLLKYKVEIKKLKFEKELLLKKYFG